METRNFSGLRNGNWKFYGFHSVKWKFFQFTWRKLENFRFPFIPEFFSGKMETLAITHQGRFYARFRVSKMIGLLKLTEDSVMFVILDEIKKLVWDWSWSIFFTFLIPTQAPHLLQAKIWIIILTAWFLMHDAWKLYVTFTRLNLYLTLTSSNCTSKTIFEKPLKKASRLH